MEKATKQEVFKLADDSLLAGTAPTPARLRERLSAVDETQLADWLAEWWQRLPGRVRMQDLAPEVPASLQQAFARLWKQAVDEAAAVLDRQLGAEADCSEQQRACDDALKRALDESADLEQRCREQAMKLDQAQERQATLEAELQQLRDELTGTVTRLKQEEQLRAQAEAELEQARRNHEEAQRVFDQRVKDDKRHSLEALAKAEVETRHYRNALEKLRDESGRKEAELGREASELRSRLARSEGRVETLVAQVRTQEESIRELKAHEQQQQRELAQVGAQLLSERNRNKRGEEQLRQLEARLQTLTQKQTGAASEAARRESELRSRLKQRDEENARLQARTQTLEKRVAALEEELRRSKRAG